MNMFLNIAAPLSALSMHLNATNNGQGVGYQSGVKTQHLAGSYEAALAKFMEIPEESGHVIDHLLRHMQHNDGKLKELRAQQRKDSNSRSLADLIKGIEDHNKGLNDMYDSMGQVLISPKFAELKSLGQWVGVDLSSTNIA